MAAAPALAAPADGAALRLDDTAMNQEYLATRFTVAIDTLKSALQLCGEDQCSPGVRAQLLRDMGVVYVAGLNDAEQGTKAFKQALAADSSIGLDPALTNPAIQAAFDAARGESGGKAPKHSGKRKHKSHSGLVHEPVERQKLGTPVPVYAEVSSDIEASVLRLYFKSAGMDTWDSVKMKRVGDGYGAEIPCSALPEHGSVSYYIRALDDDAVVAKAGSPEEPLEVQLVESLDAEDAPHFPDRPPPERCEGGAVATSGDASTVWLMAGLAQDVAFLSGADVCTQDSQVNSGYACFRASGSQYHGTPLLGQGDKINAGFALATTRVLIGGEYLLSPHVSLGVRLGYVLRGGGPRPDGGNKFMPFHAEARGSYWLSDAGINASGLAPFVFVGGGMAQVDAKHQVPVGEDPSVPPPFNQPDNPPTQTLDAWKKMGTSFVGFGIGAYYALGKHGGLLADLKGMVLFPSSGTAGALELGYAFGL